MLKSSQMLLSFDIPPRRSQTLSPWTDTKYTTDSIWWEFFFRYFITDTTFKTVLLYIFLSLCYFWMECEIKILLFFTEDPLEPCQRCLEVLRLWFETKVNDWVCCIILVPAQDHWYSACRREAKLRLFQMFCSGGVLQQPANILNF